MDGEERLVEAYQAKDPVEAHWIRARLAEAGIEAEVVGEEVSALAGAVPFGAAYPRVWVRQSEREKARELIADFQREKAELDQAPPQPPWSCPNCGNSVPGEMDLCWNCQAERGGDGESDRPEPPTAALPANSPEPEAEAAADEEMPAPAEARTIVLFGFWLLAGPPLVYMLWLFSYMIFDQALRMLRRGLDPVDLVFAIPIAFGLAGLGYYLAILFFSTRGYLNAHPSSRNNLIRALIIIFAVASLAAIVLGALAAR